MKKQSLLLVVITTLSLFVGCNKPSTATSQNNSSISSVVDSRKDFQVYKTGSSSYGEFFVMNSSIESATYDNNLLEISYTLKFRNASASHSPLSFTISNPVAYANDLELREKVFKSYEYGDDSKQALFNTETYTVNYDETKNVSFILLIQDGNEAAPFSIKFDIDSSYHGTIYTYAEGTTPKFTYAHNPSLNPKVLVDAEENENAIYGYVPKADGSLKQFVSYDWTDASVVPTYKQNRIEYIENNDAKIKALELDLRAKNKSIEQIARACSALRNQNRMDSYKDDPEGLEALKARNLEKYGHEEGPTPEQMLEKEGSWEKVLEKCYVTNAGMDAICGVYDMYFYIY